MIRQERLEYCKTCNKRGFNPNRGIICSLTNDIADFENSCQDYIIDGRIKGLANYKEKKEKKEKAARIKKKRSQEKISIDDIFLLIGITLIATFVIRFNNYINHSEDLSFLLVIIFLSSTTSLFLRKKKARRVTFWTDIKFKALFAVMMTIFHQLYMIIVCSRTNEFIEKTLVLLLLCFILSLLSVSVVIIYSNVNKVYLKLSSKNEENS